MGAHTPTSLSPHQEEFLAFLLSSGALLFGDFTTKSGRKTPYFINTGKLHRGSTIAKLGSFYASHIRATVKSSPSIIFGPAYKGIPLSVATASALAQHHGIDASFSFDRKEAKAHGDGGVFVGGVPKDGDRVIIVEDVVTAGTTLRAIVPFLRSQAAVVIDGVIISVDRCEVGTGKRSAVEELESELDVRIFPVLSIHQILATLARENPCGPVLSAEQHASALEYLSRYGAA